MKDHLGIRKHLCVLLVVHHKHKKDTEMQNHYTIKAKHLTSHGRRLIERWKLEGKSNREIASLLGKAPQTIHNEIKHGTVLQCLGKGRFKKGYSDDYAQQSYENNRKRSVKKPILTKELNHYHNQKLSPEMMVKAKGITVGISTIYYSIHHGKLRLNKQNLLYPRKGKTVKKQASPNFKPAGQSIEQRPKAINLRLENGHYEINTFLLTRAKNFCLLANLNLKFSFCLDSSLYLAFSFVHNVILQVYKILVLCWENKYFLSYDVSIPD